MQAGLYDIRLVVKKRDRGIRCFNWKTSLKKNFFALASKLNMVFLFGNSRVARPAIGRKQSQMTNSCQSARLTRYSRMHHGKSDA